MSEDFDKEAVRQRLREKYEKDKEDRESTERMSELLLQGATMTNRHCDTCGSPIFRYQGQEFCPNCQAEAQATQAESAEGQAQPEGPAQPTEGRTQAEPPAPEQAAQQPAAETADVTSAAPARAGGEPATAEPLDEASLEAIQASLTRTLATFAQRAAETEDPHRAREYLETAKAAAETLRALPR